jgi:hypothetical protein
MVLITTKVIVHVARYLAINYDEVTMINNQSFGLAFVLYLEDAFKCILILLNLKRLVGGGTINNLTNGSK